MSRFQYDIQPFPPFEAHWLRSPDEAFALAFVPDHGSLLQVRLHGQDLLFPARDGSELKLNRWARGSFLFPFPNRLEDGKFSWQGKTFQFLINDAGTSNAIHGFYGDLAFKPTGHTVNDSSGSFTFEHESKPGPASYPFPFRISLEMIIDQQEGVWIETAVTNLAEEPIPLGWGWHPYFRLPGPLEKWELELPACQLVGVDERMLPTGKRYPYDLFSDKRPIGAERLDNCFALDMEKGMADIHLSSPEGRLTYRQESGTGKYAFFQFFIPPDHESLAIEPMTCNVNALNNGDGRIVLPPGGRAQAGWGLQYHKYYLKKLGGWLRVDGHDTVPGPLPGGTRPGGLLPGRIRSTPDRR